VLLFKKAKNILRYLCVLAALEQLIYEWIIFIKGLDALSIQVHKLCVWVDALQTYGWS